MQPPEYYCNKHNLLFTVMFDKLFSMNEETDEDFSVVEWDTLNEEDYDHYAWIMGKLKKDITEMIKKDPAYILFGE